MRQSMAHEQYADERAQNHERSAGSTPMSSPGAPRMSQGRVPPFRGNAPGNRASTPPRPPPPVGMPDSRQPVSAADSGYSGVKTVGQRNPNETGMLEMVPLSGSLDAAESGVDPSATASKLALPAAVSKGTSSAPPAPSGPPTSPPVGPPRRCHHVALPVQELEDLRRQLLRRRFVGQWHLKQGPRFRWKVRRRLRVAKKTE